jgi:hypothetical protein
MKTREQYKFDTVYELSSGKTLVAPNLQFSDEYNALELIEISNFMAAEWDKFGRRYAKQAWLMSGYKRLYDLFTKPFHAA